MRKHEANKLSMFNAVVALLEANLAKLSTISALYNNFMKFKDVVEEIKSADLVFVGRTKAETAEKLAREEVLCQRIFKLASALVALGSDTGNNNLKVDCDVSKYELMRMRDTLLVNKSSKVLEYAETYKTDLASYGVNQQKIDYAKDALYDFEKSISGQTVEHEDAVATRKDITERFQVATEMLNDKLDRLIELFMDDDTHFYNEYQTARVIKDLGLGSGSSNDDTTSDDTTNQP